MGSNKTKCDVKVQVKKTPVKAGSSMPRNIGGVLNRKLVAIVKRKKRR